jgi:hypothetical protein
MDNRNMNEPSMDTKQQNALKRHKWLNWLLMMAVCLASSASLLNPAVAIAQSSEADQFGPSNYMPLLLDNKCYGKKPESNPIGTQIYGASGSARNDFVHMQNTQTAWIRVSINWRTIEPELKNPRQYRWGSVDAALRAAVENCANLIVTIDETTDWATILNYRSPIKTEYLDEYRDFVVAAVERYDGDGINDSPTGAVVNYWEFYNEPDFGSEVPGHEGWGEYGARYAQMLQAVYEPVKAANPNAQIVFGGIAYNLFANEGSGGLFIRDFFQNVLDAGGGEYFDIMNFHYYPFDHNRTVWTQTKASGLREKFNDLHQKMVAAGIGDKPFMITEVGWHSRPLQPNSTYPSTPEYQARRVVELMTQATALGSKATIWWAFGDLGGAFPYETGLLTPENPPSPKPAYYAYLEVSKRLGNATFDGEVAVPTVDNDLEAYRFRAKGTNRIFYVAWLNPVAPFHNDDVPGFDDSARQNLTVNGKTARIINREGVVQQTITDAADGNTDGKITVSVGRNPIYIEILE